MNKKCDIAETLFADAIDIIDSKVYSDEAAYEILKNVANYLIEDGKFKEEFLDTIYFEYYAENDKTL